ncbi:MAG: hypothetical protein Q8939_06010 [Bacteroidota bacterium]|nr:hypothetical protein [Bacteroidota bacterium]
MPDFSRLLAVCNKVSSVSAVVLDKFLMYYAAAQEGLEREMDGRLARFREVTKGFKPAWVNLLKAQYIGHRIFKKDGLIHKYLHHTAVKALEPEQLNYLKQQSAHAWRYSFSEITAHPEGDFYEMEDVFSGENFLLYSPSVTAILATESVTLWLNLIGFNGSCWQSYGPVLSFQGFQPDDIFFFATELNPRIETEEDLMKDMEANPFPYLMLINGSRYPMILHGKDMLVQVLAEHPLETFDSSGLKKDFKVEYAKSIYRLTPKAWGEAPHFAAAYFDEDKKIMLLTSLTDQGFRRLTDELNAHGFKLPADPDIHVQPAMLTAVKSILKKDLHLNPYEKLFERKSTPGEQEMTKKLNRLLSLAIPLINAGKEPDIDALAKEAGVDMETARDVLAHTMSRIGKLRNQLDKKGKKKK